MLMSLLTPTPILLASLRYGLRMGLLVVGLAAVALTVLLGSHQSLLFFAEYGVMAIVMAETVRRRWPIEKTFLIATGVSLLVSGIVMVTFLWSAPLDLAMARQQLEEHLDRALRPYLGEVDAVIEAQLLPYIQETLKLVIQLFPALLVMSTAAGVILNYSVVRILWRRVGGPPLFPDTALSRWKAPDACVWILIGGGILSFLPSLILQAVGRNIVLLVGAIYLTQGLAIAVYYLNKGSVPVIFRGTAYVFLLVQPLLLFGVAAFGLFDLWCDFRRIGNKREGPR